MRLARRVGALGAALCALASGGLWAKPEAVAADEAPQAWVAYAQRVSQRFQDSLEGSGEAAQRFHAFFEQRAASEAQGAAVPPILSVKTWVNAQGQITRVEFAPLGSDAADADLRALLLGQRIGAPPPRGMRQPVVVRLSLAARL
ncbi:hypothetical protein [Burkholderia alba]|uniref:hypothetical protein n=1 Tax=Burkholderia alba TaxID=2683677 RepID=UPI002B05EFA9|nr:hypothetical protein [Burkholderia alba]